MAKVYLPVFKSFTSVQVAPSYFSVLAAFPIVGAGGAFSPPAINAAFSVPVPAIYHLPLFVLPPVRQAPAEVTFCILYCTARAVSSYHTCPSNVVGGSAEKFCILVPRILL